MMENRMQNISKLAVIGAGKMGETLIKALCRRSHYFPIFCSDYFHRFSTERKGHAPTGRWPQMKMIES